MASVPSFGSGCQVLERCLKDRKGRTLSYDEVTHYGKIVVDLK